MRSLTLILACVASLTLAGSLVWAEADVPASEPIGTPLDELPLEDDLGLGLDAGLGLEVAPAPADAGVTPQTDPTTDLAAPAGDATADTAAETGAVGTVDNIDSVDLETDPSLADSPPPAAADPALEAAAVDAASVEPAVPAVQDMAPDPDASSDAIVVDETTEVAEPVDMADTLDATPDLALAPALEPMARELGPVAVDANGVVGRVHTVARGDTLWDISAAYFGTPWVWPTVWKDNDEISNPHVIEPGDRIWITAGEMRLVSDRLADEMISAVGFESLDDVDPMGAGDDQALALDDDVPAEVSTEEDLMDAGSPASMQELPVALPLETPAARSTGAMVRVSEAESLGYVSADEIKAAASVIDSPVQRVWLADGDKIYIGLGEGEVEAGDEFTIFRDADPVRDLDGGLLGYHVEVLGWARVDSVDAEASTAEIRMSQSEIRRGDRVVKRAPININVPIRLSPDAIPGNIVFMPDSRTAMGDGEWVYLNRGALHGLEPGTEVEVYEAGRMVRDSARRTRVLTPDNVVAQLIVVDVQPDSCVAYIVHTRRILEIGDKIRPRAAKLASR